MTILEAIDEVKDGVIPGVRGTGTAAIVMQDGRRFGVVSAYGPLILMTEDGRQVTAGYLEGEEVDRVEWHVDALGGIVGG
jgi:hypothetical protein